MYNTAGIEGSPSFLTLNTTGALLTSSVVDSDAGYAYFGTGSSPARIFKVRLSDFTNVADLTLALGENTADAAIIDPSQALAYVGTSSGQVVKVDLTTFSEVASVNPGLGGVTSATLDSERFAYFGTATGSIFSLRLSDFTVDKSITLTPSTSVGSAVVDVTNRYAYFGSSGCGINIFYTPPNVIVKLRLTDFTIVAQLDPGEDCLKSADIDPFGGFVYFAGANLAGSYLLRIRLSDFSITGVLSPAPIYGVNSVVVDPDRGLGYVGDGQCFFSTFRLSDFNQIGSVYVGCILDGLGAAALDQATGYVYSTGKIFESDVRMGVVVRLGPVTLPSNDFNLEARPFHLSFQDGSVGAGYVTVESNDFSGNVNLSSAVSSRNVLKPTAAILNPTLALIANGENSSILTITAPIEDDIPASTYVLTLTGSSGLMSRSVSLLVTLTPGPADFQVYVSPESIGLLPGGTYAPSIALGTHTGYTDTFNFAARIIPNIPNHPVVSVSPSNVQFSLPRETWTPLANVFISTNSTTATGQYEIEVTATSGTLRHTASHCLIVNPQGVKQFCILSSQNRLSIGPGQTRTSLVTLYKPIGLFFFDSYLGTVNFSSAIVSGPSPNAINVSLTPTVFSLPYELPGPQKLRSTLAVGASSNALSGDYVVRIIATNGTVSGFVDIPVTITPGPVPGIPGLLPADWAEYRVSSAWESTPPGLPPVPEISQYLNAQRATLRVAANLGNESASLLSIRYLNGTGNAQLISGNTIAESGTLFPWVVGSSIPLNATAYRSFAGALRLVSILNLTVTSSGVTGTGAWTWDYKTGILLDYRLMIHGTGGLGTINGLVHIIMVDTSLWTPTEPLTLTIRTLSPNPANTGETVTLSFAVDSPTPVSEITVDWGDGTITNPPADSTSDMHIYANTGDSLSRTYTVNVTATSRAGRASETRAEIVNNRIPLVAITSVSPRSVNPGQQVEVDFTAIDPDGTVSYITINWGDGTTTNNLPGTTASHAHTYNLAGNYTIRVGATDNSGSTSETATTNVMVNAQSSPVAPEAAILGLAPPLFYVMVAGIVAALGTVMALALRERKRLKPAVASNT